MRRRRNSFYALRRGIRLVLAAASLAGCASDGLRSYADRAGITSTTELSATPFFAQTENHCGPAALATVLSYSGVPATPATIAPRLFTPALKGSLQAEMLATTRSHGRIAYQLPRRLDALAREIAAGRPVVVLQNLATLGPPQWHYAVVIGIDVSNQHVILRSGLEQRLVMPAHAFNRSWQLAGRWALIALVPGDLPAELDRVRYLSAVADMAEQQSWSPAARAWRAALEVWDKDLTALVGLANALYASGDVDGATQNLRRAV